AGRDPQGPRARRSARGAIWALRRPPRARRPRAVLHDRPAGDRRDRRAPAGHCVAGTHEPRPRLLPRAGARHRDGRAPGLADRRRGAARDADRPLDPDLLAREPPHLRVQLSPEAAAARWVRISWRLVAAEPAEPHPSGNYARDRRVLLLHPLRNALIPIVTILGLDIAALMSGVVLTETVFNWPGLGRLAVQAVFNLD